MSQGLSAVGAGEDVLRDFSSPSPVLAITFGGMAMHVSGIPPFEFLNILSAAAPTKRLFLRDRYLAWYHRGIHGLTGEVEGTAAAIDKIVEDTEATKVVMLGSSGGGYAALLFGCLLGVTEVHAFAPMTFISPDLRARYGERRRAKQLATLLDSGRYRPEYGDLSPLFRRAPSPGTRFVIHYCRSHELDSVHAGRLASHPGVELRRYEEGGHRIVRHLRDSDKLKPLLRQMLTG